MHNFIGQNYQIYRHLSFMQNGCRWGKLFFPRPSKRHRVQSVALFWFRDEIKVKATCCTYTDMSCQIGIISYMMKHDVKMATTFCLLKVAERKTLVPNFLWPHRSGAYCFTCVHLSVCVCLCAENLTCELPLTSILFKLQCPYSVCR